MREADLEARAVDLALIMIVRFNRFGQIDPAESTAVVAAASGQPSPWTFYFIAVAAGVTVFIITRAMSRGRKS